MTRKNGGYGNWKEEFHESNPEPYCHYCGREFSPSTKITIDHLKPKSMGGTNYYHNLRKCCYPCNQARNRIERSEDAEVKFYWYVKYLEQLKMKGVSSINLEFLDYIVLEGRAV